MWKICSKSELQMNRMRYARVFSLRMRLLTQHARALALLAFTRCHCRVSRRTQHVKRFNLILKFIPASKEDQRQQRERQTKLDLDSEHLIEIWFCNFPFWHSIYESRIWLKFRPINSPFSTHGLWRNGIRSDNKHSLHVEMPPAAGLPFVLQHKQFGRDI